MRGYFTRQISVFSVVSAVGHDLHAWATQLLRVFVGPQKRCLHKEQISQSSSPTGLQGVPPRESFFSYHSSTDTGQIKVDFAISSCVEIGGMQV